MKILMVCLGNICRSPMAEGILSRLAEEEGLNWVVDSAGTGSWHIGEPPDRRAINTCALKGLDISGQRARQVRSRDLDEFDLILAMDRSNLRDLIQMARSTDRSNKIVAITSFGNDHAEVPDPYYDGRFEEVYEILTPLCRQVIENYR